MEFVIIWILFGAISAIIASSRGASGCGYFALGVILGPFGIIFALMSGKKCPYCASTISRKAVVCPKCQKDLRSPQQ